MELRLRKRDCWLFETIRHASIKRTNNHEKKHGKKLVREKEKQMHRNIVRHVAEQYHKNNRRRCLHQELGRSKEAKRKMIREKAEQTRWNHLIIITYKETTATLPFPSVSKNYPRGSTK